MIEELTIAGVGSYEHSPVTLSELAGVNYFYGANGAGKSTIGRAIESGMQGDFSACSARWADGRELVPFIYNREFVDRNFKDSASLKGVFTLGEENTEAVRKIEELRAEIAKKQRNAAHLKNQLDGDDISQGKRKELQELEEDFQIDCWKLKVDYQEPFGPAFRGAKKKPLFKERLLRESSNGGGTLRSLDELKTLAAEVYQDALSAEAPLRLLSVSRLDEWAGVDVLAKKIVGRDDVDMAPLISKLQHSDWVEQGLEHHAAADGLCPFCQQRAPQDLGEKLAEVFDQSYNEGKLKVEQTKSAYEQEYQALQTAKASLLALKSEFLDKSLFERVWQKLDGAVRENLHLLKEKEAELSRAVELNTLKETLSEVNSVIENANNAIAQRQELIASQDDRRQELTSDIWCFLVEESKGSRGLYRAKRKALDTTIQGMTQSLENQKSKIRLLESEIRQLECSRTGVRSTANAINEMLREFGFSGFSLKVSDDEKDYKMVRSNGTLVEETLSEGERSFLTFLYFWHLVSGSSEVSGVNAERVVVFDDPVSSLDSNVLFIVSTLVRQVCAQVGEDGGRIKQVFVLTHNAYFHKQVTYRPRTKARFWVVKKTHERTRIERFASNPVKTSYQLLWDELRAASNAPGVALRNTMRRILESYFQLLGGTKLDDLHKEFSGTKQLVFRSLISWVHDGSHSAFEEVHFSGEHSGVEVYLEVFKSIFQKTDHHAHYEMMMGGEVV